jgi:transposase
MLCLISIAGALLIMMGQHDRSEALFYYFRLEDQIPENHLLRLIDKHISFELVRERLRNSYSDTGRPSIDPELLLRILLIGYLYGITSESKLVEELRIHLAWRWFTGLGFDQEIPHYSIFSKNRHGRFQESKLFEQLFEQIVKQCMDVGLVRGDNLSVDGSFVEANAAKESRIPREQLAEAAQVDPGRKFILEDSWCNRTATNTFHCASPLGQPIMLSAVAISFIEAAVNEGTLLWGDLPNDAVPIRAAARLARWVGRLECGGIPRDCSAREDRFFHVLFRRGGKQG